MSIASVILCPPLPSAAPAYDVPSTVDALLEDARAADVRILAPDVPPGEPGDDQRTLHAHWVAHLAIALATSGAAAPLLLVLNGSAGALAPALGFAQKAARRAVAAYVLIDAATPPAESRGGDWPDAPVWYVASPAADALETNQARLRGWTVLEIDETSATSISGAIVVVVGSS